MWMMGCNDGGGFNSSNSDSFNGRKLRPLVPRPSSTTTTTSTTNIPTSNPPCLSRLHGSDLFLFNNHLATVSEQSKREFGINATTTVVSSRWNPTPEQLRTLEELYRRGTRTPSADQIQHITSQLRRYGKIEGKNVFYWFQNHKARERQKRRRRSSDSTTEENKHNHIHVITDEPDHQSSLDRKEPGSRRTGYEVEQTKNWPLPTNCSTLPQEPVSMQGAAVVASESRTNGWLQLEEGELHLRRRSSAQMNATWQMMQQQQQQQVSSLLSPSTHLNPRSTTTPPTLLRTTTDPKFTNSHQNLSIIFAPKDPHCCINVHESEDSAHTLELFPLCKTGNGNAENGGSLSDKEKDQLPTSTMNTTPYQFIEFL